MANEIVIFLVLTVMNTVVDTIGCGVKLVLILEVLALELIPIVIGVTNGVGKEQVQTHARE